jgi:hypothetical protein
MSAHRIAAATLGLGLLAGCGAFEPFPTTPLPLDTGQPPPAGQRVAVCYNPMSANDAEMQAAAQQECPADTVAELAATDYHVQTCPLLVPGRASFVCKPRK